MIIELFGPPGGGKTTFAQALAARLRDVGYTVVLLLSYRPAESVPLERARHEWPTYRRAMAVPSRLIRPVIEMARLARRPADSMHDIKMTVGLIGTIPPNSLIWSIRLTQYILRLAHCWHIASQSNHIVLFDQGFAQVVGSLALLGRAPDETLVAHALDLMPKADLLIRLDAPYEVLEARLRKRERRQSAIERLFELDFATNLESKRVIDRLHNLLRKRCQPMIDLTSLDERSLRESVERALDQITQTWATCARKGAGNRLEQQGTRPPEQQTGQRAVVGTAPDGMGDEQDRAAFTRAALASDGPLNAPN